MRNQVQRICFYLVILIVAITLSAANKANKATEYRQYNVKSGDTLWDISVAITPSYRDVRDTIDEIKDKNNLDGFVYEGQRISIPVYEEK